MKPILFALLACLLMAPGALAQGLTDPAVEHARERAARATSSPVDFAKDSASKAGTEREGDWAVAYLCFAVAYVHREHGTPDPRLDACQGYEEALGIEGEKEEAEGTVGEAENLTGSPLGESGELVEDADDTVGRILEKPTSAPEETLGLVARILAAVERILSDVSELALAATDSVAGTLGGVAGAAVVTIDAVREGLSGALDGAASGAASIGDLLGGVGAALQGGMSAFGHGVQEAVQDVGESVGELGQGIGRAVDGVGSWLGGLFEGVSSPSPSGPSASDAAGDAVDDVAGRLPCVTCLLK